MNRDTERERQDDRPLRERLRVSLELLVQRDSAERWTKKNAYVAAFGDWMLKKCPDAFITINLPRERQDQREPHGLDRDPLFYLNLWTRCAEAEIFGPRALKCADEDDRLLWIFRREVAPNGLVHYHGVVRFPVRRRWRGEPEEGTYDVSDRCQRLQRALQSASARTPEPFTLPGKPTFSRLQPLKTASALRPRLVKTRQPIQPRPLPEPAATTQEFADIDVRPIDVEQHIPYLLKGLWRFVPDWVTDETTWDSGLIILPHLPKKGTTNVIRRKKARPSCRLPSDARRTRSLVPPSICRGTDRDGHAPEAAGGDGRRVWDYQTATSSTGRRDAMRNGQAPERQMTRSSILEAERAEIIRELEGYLAVLTDHWAASITQEVAGVLAFERLNRLRDIDTNIEEEGQHS